MNNLEPYNFFVYRIENGFVQQITNTNNPDLPLVDSDEIVVERIAFYNGELCGCYYKESVFYEDAEMMMAISDPANYVKPYIEPEPVEPRYTLDEASEIIAKEVSENVG